MESLTGAYWQLCEPDPLSVAQMALLPGLSTVLTRLLALRGLCNVEQGERFLAPSWRDFHDPLLMAGMARAVDRVRQAVAGQQAVRIVTDYDVDGTTSSLILQTTLARLGARRVDYHIPDRFDEGYGFSGYAAKRAVDEGISLLITADVGVRDHDAVSVARRGGVDVLICDHHLPAGAQVPEDAYAVLCPPQAGCDYPNPSLAACGVSFKLAQALLGDGERARRFLTSLLKMAAIGTVADVVDLSTHENRAIVALGLEALSRGPNAPGLQALLDVGGCGQGVTAYDLGFRIGPRINAAGRLEHARAVVELLIERDAQRAKERAQQLDGLNSQRQHIQEHLVSTILEQVDKLPVQPLFPVFSGPEVDGWHRGVVGIVASKIRERLHRPVAVVAMLDGLAVGSVRSVPGVHAVHALDQAASILVRYGGHPAAAGFSVPLARLPELQGILSEYVECHHGEEDLKPVLQADIQLSVGALGWDLARELVRLRPFGQGNPRPLLWVTPNHLAEVRVVKERHLFFRLGAAEAVWWGGARHADALRTGEVELLGALEEDTWQGRTRLRFTIEDARRAAPSAG